MHILVVDDSASITTHLAAVLGVVGECHMAANGAQAVAMYRELMGHLKIYDLVVMDIVMPVMDGHTAVKRIREIQDEHGIPEEARTKIIMLSGFSDADTLLKAQFDTEVDLFISKPFTEKTLREALANLGFGHNPLDGLEDDAP